MPPHETHHLLLWVVQGKSFHKINMLKYQKKLVLVFTLRKLDFFLDKKIQFC